MGLPAHRYAATTQLPIVPASDGGWEWGSPDDRRAHNQGTDRWQRLGPIPAVKRQEWARMVLLCWGNRATERAKDQPVDFVREVVEDKMRDQSKERREQVIRNLVIRNLVIRNLRRTMRNCIRFISRSAEIRCAKPIFIIKVLRQDCSWAPPGAAMADRDAALPLRHHAGLVASTMPSAVGGRAIAYRPYAS